MFRLTFLLLVGIAITFCDTDLISLITISSSCPVDQMDNIPICTKNETVGLAPGSKCPTCRPVVVIRCPLVYPYSDIRDCKPTDPIQVNKTTGCLKCIPPFLRSTVCTHSNCTTINQTCLAPKSETIDEITCCWNSCVCPAPVKPNVPCPEKNVSTCLANNPFCMNGQRHCFYPNSCCGSCKSFYWLVRPDEYAICMQTVRVCADGERPIYADNAECPSCRVPRPVCGVCPNGTLCAYPYDLDLNLPLPGRNGTCVKKTCVSVKEILASDPVRSDTFHQLNATGKYAFIVSIIERNCDGPLASECARLAQNILNLEVDDNIEGVYLRVCIPDVDLTNLKKRAIPQDSVGAGLFVENALNSPIATVGLAINATNQTESTVPTSPSSTPTGAPSSTPTGAPSSTPTGAPSSTPTGAPSSTPTGAPSSTPTGSPSSTPTGSPSSTPTGSPSTTHSPNMSAQMSVGSVVLLILLVICTVI